MSALADDDPKRVASLSQPMRCWKACSQISAYLEDELPVQGRRAVEEHLANCPTRPPLQASLLGLQATLGDTRDTDKVAPQKIATTIIALLDDRLTG